MRNQKKRKFKIQVDPKFNDLMVTQFVNNLMFSGKKNISYNIFYEALEIVGERAKDTEETPLEIWKKAVKNVTPQVEVKSRRVGGATFQVPTEINPSSLLLKLWMHTKKKVELLKEKKKHIEWLKQIKHLHISDSKNINGIRRIKIYA